MNSVPNGSVFLSSSTLRVAVAVVGAVFIATMMTGCSRKIAQVGCVDTRDCDPGFSCEAGQCVEARCFDSSQCPSGQTCGVGGSCVPDVDASNGNGNGNNNGNGGGSCTRHADCQLDNYCNGATGQCVPFPDDSWCRQPSQCQPQTPICTAQDTSAPGRCVACTQNEDCGATEECRNPGVCVANDEVVCQPNASAGINGCRCNPGFVNNGADVCQPTTPDPTDPTDPVDPNNPGDPNQNPPAPQGDCVDDSACQVSGNINLGCNQNGVCECSVASLLVDCLIFGGDPDFDLCECVFTPVDPIDPDPVDPVDPIDPVEPPPNSDGTEPFTNDSCVDHIDCGADSPLYCMYEDLGASSGICKRPCSANADCAGSGPGFACNVDIIDASDQNLFTGDTGFCGAVVQVNGGCGGDFVFGWSSNNLCSVANDLLCIDSSCATLCDYDGNLDGTFPCGAGTSCGSLQSFPQYGIDIAICE